VSAAWFSGAALVRITKPGTRAHRERARLGAAVMVRRAGGNADGLQDVLTVLDLWPSSDPTE
jgi:hypothetical protein